MNIDSVIQRLLELRDSTRFVQLSELEIQKLCVVSMTVFMEESMVLDINPPLIICGDIHGHYSDLLRIFDEIGHPPQSKYLFLGDYVDRGKRSIETICLLFAYKIKYPDKFFLLRGNHECATINRMHGFYDDCMSRYNLQIWSMFTSSFNVLPAAAVIGNKIFCVHGGLSPHLENIDDIRNISRPTEISENGLLCDLIWSDPSGTVDGWGANARGVSYTYGETVVKEFLRKNDFDLIIRGHQLVEDGYQFFAGNQLVTVFSAPNYCGLFDNAGAVVRVEENLLCSFLVIPPVLSKSVSIIKNKSLI